MDCKHKLVAKPGTQISINFLKMDIHAHGTQECLTDYVKIEEPGWTTSSLIGRDGLTFCGQRLPNYPGPSVIISGNKYKIVYDQLTSLIVKAGTLL